MARDGKMDAHLDVCDDGYAGRLDVIAGPSGRRRRSDEDKARRAAGAAGAGLAGICGVGGRRWAATAGIGCRDRDRGGGRRDPRGARRGRGACVAGDPRARCRAAI